MRDSTPTFSALLIAVCLWGLVMAAHAKGDLSSGHRSGAFSLDVIAYYPCPSGQFTHSNRRVIAVQANLGQTDFVNGMTGYQGGKLAADVVKTNTIGLAPGAEFQIADGNACNERGGDGAELILPEGVSGNYSVHVRLVGKPGSEIGVTTCGTEFQDPSMIEDNVIVCAMENVIELRSSGRGSDPQFRDYTKELLTVCLLKGAIYGECKMRAALFDLALFDYFWQWNTAGLPHAQLWFKPILPSM